MPTPRSKRVSQARITSEPLQAGCLPGALLDALSRSDSPAMLDSAALDERFGRHTVIACRPIDTLALADGVLTDGGGEVLADRDNRAIWAAMDEAMTAVTVLEKPDPLPYAPGWIGYVGYEVGRHIERLPGRAVRDTHLPDMRLALYDALLVYDALEQSWTLVQLVFDDPPAGAGLAAGALRAMLAAQGERAAEAAPARPEQADAAAHPLAADARSAFTPAEYRRTVARCVEYIAAGDIFQVNLSQRLTVAPCPEPPALYRRLRLRNPAWYAAYLSFPAGGAQCSVLSSSPELFLAVRDGRVTTRPIKGTRPRIGDRRTDEATKADLLASPKDNAELAMIIDLLRNDLGRVCRYGTIRVTDPCRLETHPTVFHLVGTVEGQLCEGVAPAQLLRATFPGGSITGAPKIRAMEIIDELEPTARGVYTGCIGHVGVDGECTWNIAIRTIVCDGEAAYLQVGGGIVADSTPDAEYNETLDKARAMLEAIAQTQAVSRLRAGEAT